MNFLRKNKSVILIFCLISAFLVLSAYFSGNTNKTNQTQTEKNPTVLVAEPCLNTQEKEAEPEKIPNEKTIGSKADAAENQQSLSKLPLPENAEKEKPTCTLTIRCDTILNNMESLAPEKTEAVPSNGVILSEQTAQFFEDESVFNVLLRETRKNKIHFEFVNTPIYNSAYIEGIANLYEFDCGELSGWMYKVNGVFPNCGCSNYKLKNGDKIEFVYTCDLGDDVGGVYNNGN